MTASQPGVFVDDAAQQLAVFVISALPQGAEGAGRGNDGIVIDAILGGDLGDAVRHAGAAGDTMDQTLGPFQRAFQDFLGAAHFPQHVHVQTAIAAGNVVGDARLGDGALDTESDQLTVTLAAGLGVIDHGDEIAVLIVIVGIDAGKGGHAAGCRPRARAFAVGNIDPLAAFDQRQDFTTGNDDGV